MTDTTIATIARNLAKALQDYARYRGDDERKRIAALHAELCAEYRAEQINAASK